MKYRIGTRGSKLALMQAEFARGRLSAAYPGDAFEIVVIRTKGDAVTDRPVAEIGDNSLFTREIETALIEGRIDLAVHSMKDLAAKLPDGLTLAKAWKREDPRDVLVARNGVRSLDDLPKGATVATGSVRRDALLRRRRPDLNIVGLRGNVDTRLRKLFEPAEGETRLDAIVIAAAGLNRLGRADVISEYLDPEWMVPAANQGQLAIELRSDNAELKGKVDALGDDAAEAVAFAERAFLKETGSDCRRPVGALARLKNGRISLVCVNGSSADDLKFERRESGEVMLVGAGPGDPGLITVKGLVAIRAADAIVYDRLVSEELLKEAKAGCELVYAGKASGCHSIPQDEMNELLAELALRHARVVRLKGGDPFVLGRGGEEMAFLVAHGIKCREIPGVTSAVAAPASVGIPVTHRGVSSGFEVVTAHAKGDSPLQMDFSRFLDDNITYVFLMGLSRIGEIASSLTAVGKCPATPAAVVSSATTPSARTVVGTLADIAERVRVSALASPAVMVVGDVVRLSGAMGLPLVGRRILVPVIDGGSTSLATRLRELGADVDEVTVGRIVKIDGAFTEKDLDRFDRIVVTSKNGWLGLDERTLAAAKAKGVTVEAVRKVEPIGRTVHLTQPDAERVEGVVSIDVYRNEPVSIEGGVDLSGYDAAVFTCASSARRVYAASRGDARAFAIGRKTAAALEKSGAKKVLVAAEETLDALVAAVVADFVCHRDHASR